MGLAITDILTPEKLSLEDLRNKTLAVDTYNLLYQFLSSIRQRDGSYLTDSKGRVTSHLTGLFNRITKLLTYNIKFIFCFDGQVPELKAKERERRKGIKIEAQKKFDEAAKEEDVDAMKKYAARTTRLTSEMIEDAKELISALGQCIVMAPSEGEAQASHIAKKGDADFVLSQDADCFMFQAPKLIKNLTLSGKRKKPGAYAYDEVQPEVISLSSVLKELDINQDQLIVLGILVGTDYNIGGIKGIGPKKALTLIKKYGNDFDEVFKEAKWDEFFDFDWKQVFDLIQNMDVSDDYKLEWHEIDKDKLIKILVEEHDFSRERVEKAIERLEKSSNREQKGLGDFF
ncbi:MAG: flap endonuclease-1 [Nanoarchaeota archaeon]|nr:flap endonuclease-1 [Nanoarchaeota archaeon]MBU1321736.1 flap endonuclease-1 [Nanoarchaeota archaeon]MBU1597702.1 flap endonuclease-1 [Nanoarchaeota archaeon]MBU2442294.1 flap endonuclease-1 [Nanoarchaeota archaeon]